MHPIERLRYVARAGREGPSVLVREAAGALAGFTYDPAALVTACRRLVDRQPHAAPVWWLAARVLAEPDSAREAWAAADRIDDDPTPTVLRDLIPEDARVLALGWPELVAPALARRGDLDVFVVDALGDGSGLVRGLERAGTEATLVEERGAAAIAADVDIVLIDVVGLGPTGAVAVAGSRAAATVGHHAGRTVWAVAGVGRVLPGQLWDVYLQRLGDDNDPWDADIEFIPIDVFDAVVGPTGLLTAADAVAAADCQVVPELLKGLD